MSTRRDEIRNYRKIKHHALLNALACQGIEPQHDPEDSARFWVRLGDVEGCWNRNDDGEVIIATTRDNDQVKPHGTIRGFLDSLKRDPRKIMN